MFHNEENVHKHEIRTSPFKFFVFPSKLSAANYKYSVIWQKGESQNGGNKNTKHAKFSEK